MHNRYLSTIAAALVLCLLLPLAGCVRIEVAENPPEKPENPTVSTPASSSQSQPASASIAPVAAPALEALDSTLWVYIYNDGSGLYDKVEGPAVQPQDTLLTVLNVVGEKLEMEDIPVLSITQEKGMVVVNFADSLIESFGKARIYELFNSLATTLQQNHSGYEWIQYQLVGDHGPVGGEQWPTAPFKLIEGDAAAFAAMRVGVPYIPGVHGMDALAWSDAVPQDATSEAIATLLQDAQPENTLFDSPDQMNSDRALMAAILNTKSYSPTKSEWYGYSAQLEPIFASVSLRLGMNEDTLYLQEHVEESARRLYGPDYKLSHRTVNDYIYHEMEGVYSPPHRGGGYIVELCLLDYTDAGESITATVSYAYANEGGELAMAPPGSESRWGKQLAQGQMADHLKNQAVRYTVTLKRNEAGELYLYSQKLAAAA